jgi:hypothetical protein
MVAQGKRAADDNAEQNQSPVPPRKKPRNAPVEFMDVYWGIGFFNETDELLSIMEIDLYFLFMILLFQ